MPSRSSYFGIIDLAGFKKDRFWLYQARWRPELPMAHLLPHWNWPERVGQVTPVHLYTSGDEAELFLNGKSLGRKKRGPRDYRLRWDDVVYQPGTLKAVVYRKGKRWAEDTVVTAGKPAKLVVSADRAQLRADGKDLSFVTVSIVDKDGRPVPRTHDRITFKLSGPGEIAATDNGDATDLESFQSPQRKAFNGLALAIVKTKAGEGGKLTLSASAEGLEGAQVTLDSQAQ
jgi:beta-galactosidase